MPGTSEGRTPVDSTVGSPAAGSVRSKADDPNEQPAQSSTLARWLPPSQLSRGIRSPHLWAIVALTAFLTLLYYASYTPLAGLGAFFTVAYPHDLHRALFLLPLLYAAVTFRMPGVAVASIAVVCIVLPRAFITSPYADPLLRSVLAIIFTVLACILVAMLVDRVEKEQKARADLERAHHELAAYVRRLQENEEQLVQAEKLTSLGQLAASVAHELNNPLAGVLLYVDLLSGRLSGESPAEESATDLEYLSRIESEVSRCSRIVGNLLDFSRQSQPRLGAVDINGTLDQVVSLVEHQALCQNVNIVRELSPSVPPVLGDFDQLKQVFTNLSLNAIQAMPQGGMLTLRSSPDGGGVRVDVEDTGCGIAEGDLARIFTPFFTTKERGKGVGLGLSVAQRIVGQQEGRIEVRTEEGRGSTFSVHLTPYAPKDG